MYMTDAQHEALHAQMMAAYEKLGEALAFRHRVITNKCHGYALSEPSVRVEAAATLIRELSAYARVFV